MTDPQPGDSSTANRDRGPLAYRRAAGARLSEGRPGPDGVEYLLRSAIGRTIALGERERFLWEALDGNTSFEDIERGFEAQFGSRISRLDFFRFIDDLVANGAVEHAAATERPAALGVKRVTLDAAVGATADAGDARAEQPPQRTGTGRTRRRRRQGGETGRVGFREGWKDVWSHQLGNPEKFFAALSAVFWPIRWITWGLIPLALAGFLISVKHSDQYYADWSALMSAIPSWPCFWLAEHITTWSARIMEGIVIHGFGGRVTKTLIKLFFGLFVRLQLDESSTESMPRRHRLWIAATPLLTRLFIWGVGMICWALYRPTHPILAQISLFMAFMGLITFVMCCCPLIPLYGYKFLSILLEQENLYGRSFRLLIMKMRGRPVPYTMTLSERWGLAFMAIGTAIFTTLYLAHILYRADQWTITTLNGIGGIFALGIFLSCFLYFFALWRFTRKLRAMHRADRAAGETSPPPAAELLV